MNATDMLRVGHHDYSMVALSVIISILVAYAARDLVGRVSAARGPSWNACSVVGATVEGMDTRG
ncbi:MAG TPA: hypothetical protein VGB17_12320 [Pyrinomonadaceae bacterium]|jgi:NO-binding membrane sensor protein with MHYT domain